MNTVTTWTRSFHQKFSQPTKNSSSMLKLSEEKLEEDKGSYLPTTAVSHTFTLPSYSQMELRPSLERGTVQETANLSQIFATGSTQSPNVQTTLQPADTDTFAVNANTLVTPSRIAMREKERLHRNLHPKYLQYNIYCEGSFSLATADWTEHATPLPPPPKSEIENPIAAKTIVENPSLFTIVTPIDVDRFEFLLKDHPNQPFVSSVCCGLRDGFWPCADTLKDGYLVTHYASLPTPKNPTEAAFLCDQRDIEEEKGCFSIPFGKIFFLACIACPSMLCQNLGHWIFEWSLTKVLEISLLIL